MCAGEERWGDEQEEGEEEEERCQLLLLFRPNTMLCKGRIFNPLHNFILGVAVRLSRRLEAQLSSQFSLQ